MACASFSVCTTISLAHAAPNTADLTQAERWAWSQIAQGLPANFSEHCRADLDPKNEDDPGWKDIDACRSLPGGFLVRILTEPHFHDAMTHKGVEIQDARIIDDVDFKFAKIDRPLQVKRNQFMGKILLSYATATGLIFSRAL